MLDRDRLPAVPEERLTFLAECRQAGVKIVLCQWPPLLDGDMGTLLEHVRDIEETAGDEGQDGCQGWLT